ncbi:hypothetical protein [Pseudophaeobacter arcticus]|jgi:hypothetical protein|uniref:hypothetical protein n=1 Tax=Pseudophaeobacter arcticus TaxID=385492 RepID=UPI00248FE0F7|nr:hypothetical protein [Pseudophaeobacter arcticus]
MASVEVMTACENVCRDFGWLWDLLPVEAVPALTLIFAIYAFFSQRANDRKAELRHYKRKLYPDLLRQLSIAFNDVPNEEGWEYDERYLRARDLVSEVSLLNEFECLEPHTKKAIEAINGQNQKERRGMADPKGAGGRSLSDENREYVGKDWVFNRDLFEAAIDRLSQFMRQDLAC